MFKEFEEISRIYFSTNGSRELRRGSKVHKNASNDFLYSLPKNANVVDAGCGSSYFKGIFPNLIAFDIVDYGNQDYVCSIMNAPIEEGSQDGVFCFGVLHECPDEYHLPNIEKMLSWLKPDGKLIMRCKSKIVKSKHPYMSPYTSKDANIMKEYFDQGLWPIERVNQFTQQLNLTLNWIEPKTITRKQRKQQWNSNPKKHFHSSHNNDIIFDGYIWSWNKNV